jgi:hypothetical protein
VSRRAASPSAMRLQDYLEAVTGAIEASGLFVDVRLHLDPYGIDDVLKENFKVPAARVFLLKMETPAQASSARDLKVTIAVAVVAGREGRPDPRIASADIAAMGLVIDVAALIHADPYFGLAMLTQAQVEEMRIAVSEKSSGKGLAITLLQATSTLLKLIPEWPGAAAAFDATRPAEASLVLNGEAMTGTAP